MYCLVGSGHQCAGAAGGRVDHLAVLFRRKLALYRQWLKVDHSHGEGCFVQKRKKNSGMKHVF